MLVMELSFSRHVEKTLGKTLTFSRHVEKTFASFSRHGRHGGCGRCRGHVGHGWWWRCRREEELQFCHLSGRCPSSHTVFPDERVFRQLSVSHLLLTRIPVVRTLRHAVDIEVQAYYGLWRRWRHGLWVVRRLPGFSCLCASSLGRPARWATPRCLDTWPHSGGA